MSTVTAYEGDQIEIAVGKNIRNIILNERNIKWKWKKHYIAYSWEKERQ